MRTQCLLLAVLGLALSTPLADAESSGWLDHQARMGRFHGVSVLAVPGAPRDVVAHGHADVAGSLAHGADVAYGLGSIAKPLTALAVMQLVEADLVGLDDAIGRHLPRLAGKPAAGVTIAQLLSHSGGVPSVMRANQGLDAAAFMAAMDQPMTRDALLAEFVDAPLLFEPGSRYGYSNSGYILLAMLLEQIDARDWAASVEARVLARAGIRDACFCPRLSGRTSAEGIEVHADGRRPARAIHSDRAPGAGALLATPEAMLDLVDALLAGRVLARPTLERMWEPVVATGQGDAAYGLGWEIQVEGGRRLVGHAGGMPGMVAHLVLDPESGTAAIGVDNLTAPIESLGWNQARIIRQTTLRLAEHLALPDMAPPPALAPAATAAAWRGRWRVEGAGTFTLVPSDGGSLVLQTEGGWSIHSLRQSQRLASAEAQATTTRALAWARGDAAPLRAAMDEAMAAQLDETRLAAMFASIAAPFGPLEDAWVFAADAAVHRMRFRFATAAIDIAFLLDDQGRIAGLRLDGRETEPAPTQARLWPLADGRLLLDRDAMALPDQAWQVQALPDGRRALIIDAGADLRALPD